MVSSSDIFFDWIGCKKFLGWEIAKGWAVLDFMVQRIFDCKSPSDKQKVTTIMASLMNMSIFRGLV
jgi:hypothetical protein